MDAYDVLFMRCDGANNGTVFTDDTGKTITSSGTISTKTNHYKVGTSSIYFGTSAMLSLDASADWQFGTGDFTIEFYMSTTQAVNYPCIMAQYQDNSWGVFLNSTGKVGFYNHPNATTYWSNTSVNDSVWHHVAMVRYSSNFYIYVDGVSDITPVAMTSNHAANVSLRIGYDSANTYYQQGYLDQIRISKGIARYTADFVPPGEIPFQYLKSRGRSRFDMSPVSGG